MLSTLRIYFETNWNNIKNTWKGIKSLIFLKTVASSASSVLSRDNGNTINIPMIFLIPLTIALLLLLKLPTKT